MASWQACAEGLRREREADSAAHAATLAERAKDVEAMEREWESERAEALRQISATAPARGLELIRPQSAPLPHNCAPLPAIAHAFPQSHTPCLLAHRKLCSHTPEVHEPTSPARPVGVPQRAGRSGARRSRRSATDSESSSPLTLRRDSPRTRCRARGGASAPRSTGLSARARRRRRTVRRARPWTSGTRRTWRGWRSTRRRRATLLWPRTRASWRR
eukprot:5725333-Prymnesium_polylepis.1